VGKEVSSYEQRCDQEMAAAGRTLSHEARLAHLEMALRFALLAHRARQNCEIVDLKSRNVPDVPPA
jgi:predicted transposase YdaD